MDAFSIFYTIMVFCVYSLESPRGAILMSTHNIHFHVKVRKFPNNTALKIDFSAVFQRQ